jgi:hypothetical protein
VSVELLIEIPLALKYALKFGVLTPPFTNPDVSAVPPLAIGNVPVTLLAKFID